MNQQEKKSENLRIGQLRLSTEKQKKKKQLEKKGTLRTPLNISKYTHNGREREKKVE